MSQPATEVAIEVVGEDREVVQTAFRQAGLGDATVATKRHLTGAEPIIIILLKLAVASVPLVTQLLHGRRVKKIRVGDIEIENPTEEEIATLMAQHATSQAESQKQ